MISDCLTPARARRLRPALLLLIVACLVLAPLRGAVAEGDCGGQTTWDYTLTTASFSFELDVSPCGGADALGSLVVHASLEREPVDPVNESDQVEDETTCDPDLVCRLAVELAHPDLEWARYTAEVNYHSEGGAQVIAGYAFRSTSCIAAVASTHCGDDELASVAVDEGDLPEQQGGTLVVAGNTAQDTVTVRAGDAVVPLVVHKSCIGISADCPCRSDAPERPE